jgi:hypothetical protein
MAKVTGPVLSLDAAGSLKKTLTYQNRPSGSSVYLYKKPGSVFSFTPSASQQVQRSVIGYIVARWKLLSAAQKAYMNNLAKSIGYIGTGYHYFLHTLGLYPVPIYGVSWNKGLSPILTRTDNAVGMVANAGVGTTAVTNDFDRAEIYKEITQVTDSLGNVFMRIPKFYIKKTDGVNSKTWQISKSMFAGAYLPACFWNFTTSTELAYIDIGKYNASLSGANKLESLPNTYPLINKTIINFRTYAQANGSAYQQLDIHTIDVLQTLFIIEFATLNSQSIFAGYTGGRYVATDTATVAENNANRIIVTNAVAATFVVGQAISVGTTLGGTNIFYGRTITSITVYDGSNKALNFDGAAVNIAIGNIVWSSGWKSGFSSSITAKSGSPVSNSDSKHPAMYRGIENLFGSVWQFVDGVNITDRQAWICANAVNYASNLFASPYTQLGYVNGNTNGYPIEMGWDANNPHIALPITVGGGTTTYYSDYYYQDVGQRIAVFGGNWSNGAGAGLFSWYLYYSSSYAGIIIGGRLLKKAL